MIIVAPMKSAILLFFLDGLLTKDCVEMKNDEQSPNPKKWCG